MILIIGGANQGKLEWYLHQQEQKRQQVCEGSDLALDSLPPAPVLNHLHNWVRRMVQAGKDGEAIWAVMQEYLQRCPDAVILYDEIGCGVVPIDPTERLWREETGRLCCRLAERAERVERVFCSIGMTIKGGR